MVKRDVVPRINRVAAHSEPTSPKPDRPPKADPRSTHAIDFRGPWVIAYLDDAWEAVYRLAPQGPEIVITGVEIRPRRELPAGGLTTRLARKLRPALALELFRGKLQASLTPDSPAARSEAAALMLLAVGALTAQLVPEDLVVGDVEAYLASGAVTPEAVAEAIALFEAGELPAWQQFVREMSERWTGWGAAFDELEPGSRQPPRNRLRRLAETAELYVQARAANQSAPNRRVAEIQGRTAEKVRDDLRAARQADLLTVSPGRGRAGGTLTAKARAILASE